MMMKKSIKFVLFIAITSGALLYNVQNALSRNLVQEGSETVCTVSSNTSNNWGKCMSQPAGNYICSIIVTAGNECNGVSEI